MIYTVTLNPAIDYVVLQDKPIDIQGMNRVSSEEIQYGGKGINVSCMLKNLGISSVALGFAAGFTGDGLVKGLQNMGVDTDFVHLDQGMTRINVKVKTNTEMEINGNGPYIAASDMEKLRIRLDKINDGDVIILSGSAPRNLPDTVYAEILNYFSCRKIISVVDTTGNYLMNTLPYKPFLIKPNIHEIEDIFGEKAVGTDTIVTWAMKLKEKGAVNVLISLGRDGAILVDENKKVHRKKAVQGNVINSVGAGDAMIAGFLTGYLETKDYSYALSLGVATGSATAFSKGLANKEQVYALLG